MWTFLGIKYFFVRLFKEIPGGKKNKKTPWISFFCCLTDGKVTKQPVEQLAQSKFGCIYSSAYWLSKPFFRAATQCCGWFTTDPQRKTGACYCILTSLVSLCNFSCGTRLWPQNINLLLTLCRVLFDFQKPSQRKYLLAVSFISRLPLLWFQASLISLSANRSQRIYAVVSWHISSSIGMGQKNNQKQKS